MPPTAFLVLAGIAIVCLAAEPLALLPLHIQRNYNEGWGALFTDIALSGGALYPPPGAFISNNYPPLSFYIVGALSPLVGDHVIALRLIALVSYLAVTVCVWRAVFLLSGSRRWALAAGMLFLFYGVSVFRDYFAMADPQWLAHAVATPALVLLLRRPVSALPGRDIVAACLLMLAAGLIKHNLLALPAATTLWLAWHDRRRLAIWLVAGIAGACGILALLYAMYGTDVFASVADHHRAMRLANVIFLPWEQRALLPVGVGALVLLRRRADPRIRLVLIFAVIAGLWGAFQRLGEGVAYNAQFEMFVALTIAAGAGMATLEADGVRWPRPAWLRRALVLMLFLPLAQQAGLMLAKAPARLAHLPENLQHWQALRAAVDAEPGPVACERLAVCYWAGKGFELDFFNYGERLYAGVASPGDFEALLASRRLRLILVAKEMFGADDRPVFPQPSVDAMLRYYRVEQSPVADYQIMRPRS
ncbi:hypothetical protein [Emcibacter sp. SYSU 3D8]|uniref:hypothetical protein n=1 Tax=Emcibacter sp. SYSU 3D8 TaxID=3133969 RepID=UPI0031FEA3AE